MSSNKERDEKTAALLDRKPLPDGCPKCGANIAYGYGLAGGGMGSYTYCENGDCDYFDKVQDKTDSDPEEKKR